MNPKLKSPEADSLFEAILSLKDREECYDFFEDLCTVSELREMQRRWQVAKMLQEGRVYREITEATRLSAATVSRVNACLRYGAGGYALALKRTREK